MKKWGEIALGIATSVGGFLDVGSIATSAQAGAEYRFKLLWAVGLGTLCLIFLTEMSGRLAAVSGHTVTDAVRERFGATAFVLILLGVGASSMLVLGAEIGGTCLALQLATGIHFQWWAIPVARRALRSGSPGSTVPRAAPRRLPRRCRRARRAA